MKKTIMIIGVLMSLMSIAVFAEITVSPTTWNFDYELGVDSSKAKTFTFTNNENVSRQVSLLEFGLSPIDLTFSYSSFSIPALATKDITVIANVPLTADTQKRTGGFLVQSESGVTVTPTIVTMAVNITDEEEDKECNVDSDCTSSRVCKDYKCVPKCRIEALSTEVERIFKQDSEVSTEKFYIYMTKGCDGDPVIYKSAEFTGTIQTDEGKKPARLSSKQLVTKEYGDEPAEFEVTYDVKGVENKVYTPVLTILARHGDDTISTAVNFNIIVTGTVTPVSSSDELDAPDYEIPKSVRTGETFEIRAKDVNPNLQPQIFFNPSLVGISCETKNDDWVWKGYINESGTHDISIASFYNGGPIGGVYTQEVIVVEELGKSVAGNLTFELHPPLSELVDGQTCSILVRDKNNIVDNAILYINGVRDDDKQFVYNKDVKYQLSATHPNYYTADLVLEHKVKDLLIVVNPTDLEEGERGMVSVSDAESGILISNASITYDDIAVIGGSFAAGTIGNHVIKVVASGYTQKSVPVEVTAATMLGTSPDELKRNKENTLTLTKPNNWYVQWSNQDEKKPESANVASGMTNTITFTPEKNGLYQIYVRNRPIKSYELTGFTFGNFKWSWWYLLIIIIAAVVIYIILVLNKGGGGSVRTGRVGYGLPPSDGNVVSPL